MAKQRKNRDVSETNTNQVATKKEYTEEEQVWIDNYLKRSKGRLAKIKHSEDSSGNQQMNIQEADMVLGAVKMMKALGTPDSALQNYFLTQTIQIFKGCVSEEGLNKELLTPKGHEKTKGNS